MKPVRENPCPRCRSSRRDLESRCGQCGWRPNASRTSAKHRFRPMNRGSALGLGMGIFVIPMTALLGFWLFFAAIQLLASDKPTTSMIVGGVGLYIFVVSIAANELLVFKLRSHAEHHHHRLGNKLGEWRYALNRRAPLVFFHYWLEHIWQPTAIESRLQSRSETRKKQATT